MVWLFGGPMSRFACERDFGSALELELELDFFSGEMDGSI